MSTVQIVALIAFLLTPWFALNILYPFKKLGIKTRKSAFFLTVFSFALFVWAGVEHDKTLDATGYKENATALKGTPEIKKEDMAKPLEKPMGAPKFMISFEDKEKIVNYYKTTMSSIGIDLQNEILSKNKNLHYGALMDVVKETAEKEAECRILGIIDVIGKERMEKLVPLASYGHNEFDHPSKIGGGADEVKRIELLFQACRSEFMANLAINSQAKNSELEAENQKKALAAADIKRAEDAKREAQENEIRRKDEERRKALAEKLEQERRDAETQRFKDGAIDFAKQTVREGFRAVFGKTCRDALGREWDC